MNYHGENLTLLGDADGSRYGRGAGLRVFTDGRRIAHADRLQPIAGKLWTQRESE